MSERKRTVFRRLDGIVLLDKPAGISSNQALQRVRHLLRAAKGGHTGALDPLATGMLPLCLGEATKIAGLLLGSAKAYRVEARLGLTTDSDDADGRPLRTRAVPPLDRDAVEAALLGFVGRIRQRPPVYSALKRDGQPLYRRARRGEVVDPGEREVEVHALRLLELGSQGVTLEVDCGSGTYVRSLVRDLGEVLDCGAHVTALRRLWVAPFEGARMFTLEEIKARVGADDSGLETLVLPLEAGLAGWPRLVLADDAARRLRQGQRIRVEAPARDAVAVGPAGRALGLVTIDNDGNVRIRRLFVDSVQSLA